MFSFSRRFFHLIILAALTASLAGGTMSVTPARAAGTLYAAPADLGSGDCSSWASACDLQQALSAATSGDQIWVMSGVHKPTNTTDRTISFSLESGVEIYGGFAGTETSLNQRDPNVNITVLSGDIDGNDTVDGNGVTTTISGSNSYHVVTASSVGATAILDGFIITGGRANGLSPADLGFGGGMFNWNSNPTLANVTFSGNFADFGGGIFNASSSPALINVTFSGNIASEDGGGTYNSNSNPTLTNVTFSGNIVGGDGGGMVNDYNSNPTLTNVIFSGNTSYNYGGGMHNYGSSPTLTNVTFSGNSARFGGGMSNQLSSPTLTNVTFSGNFAQSPTSIDSDLGGGMYNFDSSPTLANVIIWGNTALNGGAGIYNDSSTPAISYSDIQDCGGSGSWNSACGTNGGGNIEANPLFVDADGADNGYGTADDNLHLQAGSPAIDAGTNSGCPAADQRGVSRPQDGNGDSTAICDIGAFEMDVTPPSVVSITRADANPTSKLSVNFTVTFSEDVTGVDESDFTATVVSGSITGAGVTGVTPVSESEYTVLVNTGSGSGTLRLDLNASGTGITDLVGNPISAGFTGGESYTVQKSLTFHSSGAQDGWVLESSETSGMGGTMNASAATFDLGD
ncbi:MAG: hypothetical protein DPW18_07290, partial [Chloroflexi bacterium]|nr:hypothetical protein [Chloroflexota bacterium]MDL1945024.1 hypothetical protein [Chloroflexi bacterium CFX2]